MENLLLKYMENRLGEEPEIPVVRKGGPVVTLSREAGCPGNLIAQRVFQLIQGQYAQQKDNPWRVLNKEIVAESAQALSTSPEKISYVFRAEDRKWLDEMIFAMSTRYHKSDAKVRKTIINVIQNVIENGNVVLVGRGGVAFTKNHPNSLNIYLQAPPEWRIEKIKEFKNLPHDKALEFMTNTDHDRKALVNSFYGGETNTTIFDIVFNCSKMNIDMIAGTIFHLMKIKQMLP
jgi:cytidylate kinase